jgi:endothelin-converting enzyme/putative endopeptidase
MKPWLLGVVAAAALLAGCGEKKDAVVTAAPAAPAKPAYGAFGLMDAALDASVKPGDDFYRYANGTWLATAKIPADKTGYGIGWILSDKCEADVHEIVEALAKTPQTQPSKKKVADLYAAWMDTAAIEKRGIEPLKPYLDKVAAVKTQADLMKMFGDQDFASPLGWWIGADPADTTKYAVSMNQDGLGMPGRDYYLNAGPKFDAYRAAYKAYVTTLLKLSGDATAEKDAAAVYALEAALAKVQWSPARQRDVRATYNPMDRAGLAKLAPDFDWPVILAGLGLADTDRVIVGETTAITASGKLVKSTPIGSWRAYLAFHVINDNAMNLPKAFDDARFGFYSKTIRGQEQQRDRWKRGIVFIDGAIGEALGQAYVEKHFSAESKTQIKALVANLLAALKSRLEANTWMDEPTRAAALVKLGTFDPRVGYPDKWRDYSGLTIEPGKLFEGAIAARRFEWNRRVARIHSPVDRGEWDMTPSTFNAYYDSTMNQITFPAGILQPPYFDAAADPAVNYGSIGAVIGHEIGHGFDDQGKEYDEKGRIRNWWTDATTKKFKAATDALAAQYHAYCPIPGDPKACIDGELTMGENIGDLGGLEMALTAYHMSLDGKEPPVLGGLTGDQRFFIAYAQSWQALMRDDAVRALMLTNPHAPDTVRGQNPERNMDAWYAAFNVKPGDKMYLAPEKRVHIW